MKNGVLKIDKGIPLPEYTPCGRGLSDEALLARKMVKGDSMLVHKKLMAAHAFAARHIGKGKYAVKEMDDGVRIWKR